MEDRRLGFLSGSMVQRVVSEGPQGGQTLGRQPHQVDKHGWEEPEHGQLDQRSLALRGILGQYHRCDLFKSIISPKHTQPQSQ